MSALRTFEQLLPEDLAESAPSRDAGDDARDSLADLRPVPTYQQRPVSHEELRRAIDAARGYVYCGKQRA